MAQAGYWRAGARKPGKPNGSSGGADLNRDKLLRLVILAGVVLVFVLPSWAVIYTDWLWFGELGFRQVFLTTLSARFTLGVLTFLIAFAVLYANIRLAQTALKRRDFVIMGPEGARTISVDLGRLRPLLYIGSVVAAGLIALYASARWDVWLMARHAVPFGTTDPVLGYDISFYVFRLPFLQFLHGLAMMTIVLGAIGVAIAHVMGQSLMIDPARGVIASQEARRHLSLLAAVVLLLL